MLEEVRDLINRKEWVNALQALDPYMQKYPVEPMGLFLLGQIMLETEKQSIAYPIYKLATTLEPKRPEMWINMGKAAGELHFYEEEEKCFRKAITLAKAQKNELAEFISIQNMASCGVHQADPNKAIHWANKSLKIERTKKSLVDLGYGQLMQKNYKEGWKNYNEGLGITENREIKSYIGEPEWDGSPDKHILIYGEQGLGDQIAFASAVRDARRISKSVILDVTPKFKNLASRSFVLETHGYGKGNNWMNGRHIDASVSMSRIQEYLRDDVSKYTGKPYLIADSNRRLQWKALFDSFGDKLKVGIAWNGGVHSTQRDERSTPLKNILKMLNQDVTWISLEYEDSSEEVAEAKKS